MEIAAFIVLVIVIVILGIAFIKARYPHSVIAKDVTAAEARVEAVSDHVMSDIRAAEPAVKAGFFKAELGVGTELSKLLGEIEVRLMDTSGEDAAIATAQQYLARVTAEVQASIDTANTQKAQKLTALQAHIATLQATALPASGS